MNYYSHHIGDYAAHTGHLSLLEHGVYRRMIDIYYLSESAFSSDVAAVCRKVGAKSEEEKLAVDAILNEFFVLTDDGFSQKRCDAEIDGYKAKIEQASRAGKVSAERKANARSTTVQRPFNDRSTDVQRQEPVQRQESVQPTNNQEPITNNHKPVKSKTEPAEKKQSDALATRLPDNWLPNEFEVGFCNTERPDLMPMQVAEQFRDYWIAQPGAKGRKVDWSATWRNWVRNQRAPQARASPHGYESAKDKSRREAIENLTGYKNGSYEIIADEGNPFLLGQ